MGEIEDAAIDYVFKGRGIEKPTFVEFNQYNFAAMQRALNDALKAKQFGYEIEEGYIRYLKNSLK